MYIDIYTLTTLSVTMKKISKDTYKVKNFLWMSFLTEYLFTVLSEFLEFLFVLF